MPSVPFPAIIETLYGGLYGTDVALLGFVPLGDYDPPFEEVKDRFGGPNYGSGPFFYSKVWPLETIVGLDHLPPPFGTATGAEFWGAGRIYFTPMQGSHREGRLSYSRIEIDAAPGWDPVTGYYIRAHQDMYLYERDSHGDWWYSYHFRDTDGWSLWMETDIRDVTPIPSEGNFDGLSWEPFQSFYKELIVSHDCIVSDRVQYMRVVGNNVADRVNFLHGDFDAINSLDIYTSGNASDFQAAYVDACDDLLNSKINSIANILELANTIKGICELLHDPVEGIKDLLKTYKDPRNAWLAYRYSYKTTKADVKEYIQLIDRLKKLTAITQGTIEARGKNGKYNCTIVVNVSDILPSTVYDFLSMVGIEPNAQNIWDMIPYSFVVDWFAGISDVMEWFDNWTYSITIEPTEIWFSYLEEVSNSYRVYYRVRGRKLNVPPRYVDKTASGKTWLCRFGDAVSLFT